MPCAAGGYPWQAESASRSKAAFRKLAQCKKLQGQGPSEYEQHIPRRGIRSCTPFGVSAVAASQTTCNSAAHRSCRCLTCHITWICSICYLHSPGLQGTGNRVEAFCSAVGSWVEHSSGGGDALAAAPGRVHVRVGVISCSYRFDGIVWQDRLEPA